MYPRVYHTNEPIKFPEILADGHEHQTSSSWIVPSVLATEVTPLLFLKPNSAILVKNAEVHGERGFDATSGGRTGGVPLCHFDLRYPGQWKRFLLLVNWGLILRCQQV